MGENGWASANVHNGGWGSTESKWSLLHQLGSHGEGRVPRPPVQADSLGASGPYGHNTLTGLYFTPSSFNQSTGHILCPSMHGFVFPSQKLVFIQMHLQLFSQPFCCCVFSHTAAPNTDWFHTDDIQISDQWVSALFHLYSRNHGWMFNPDSTFCDKNHNSGGKKDLIQMVMNSFWIGWMLTVLKLWAADLWKQKKKKITFTVIVVTVIKEKSSELMKDELII